MAAVASRVRIVCLDHIAEQQSGPAIRVAQLECVVDPPMALAAEVAQEADEREDEHDELGPGVRCEREDEPDRRERSVDDEDEADEPEQRSQRDPVGDHVHTRVAEVEGELREQRRDVDRPRRESQW